MELWEVAAGQAISRTLVFKDANRTVAMSLGCKKPAECRS